VTGSKQTKNGGNGRDAYYSPPYGFTRMGTIPNICPCLTSHAKVNPSNSFLLIRRKRTAPYEVTEYDSEKSAFGLIDSGTQLKCRQFQL
jgi:hypothetical protein